MATLAPFKGLYYNFKRLGDIAPLLAPPYDVISEEQQDAYYLKHPNNVIRLILGKKKTGDSNWDNRYTRAADCFNRWQSDDVLVWTSRPSMLITSLTYDPGGGQARRTRWGLIALVHIEEDESGVILPHERTFSAHKDDRLNLMRACSAQFSQIFGLFEDGMNKVFGELKPILMGPPKVAFDFEDDTSHRVWVVQDPAVFRKVTDLMSDKTIFIADGHHRYETARNFRNIMRARYGKRHPNRSYEYVMMYLSNMDDRGLTILPSHRLVKRCEGFRLDAFLERLSTWFDVSVMPPSQGGPVEGCRDLKERLEEAGRNTSAIGFRYHGDGRSYILCLKPGARESMGEDLHPSLKELDVLVLSRLILQKSLGFAKEDLDDEEIFHYQSDMVKTVSEVESGSHEMAFLLNATKMEQVKEVASNKLIMPRKSTYFYPKVLTGLIFNKIDPHELIEIP